MTKLILITLLLSGGALYADESPFEQDSVWKHQESGAVNAFEAKVQNVNLAGLKVTLEKLEAGEESVIQTVKICTQDAAVNEHLYTEADRAMAIGLRVQAFRSAEKKGEAIKVGIRGPWSPCVYPISI